MFTKPPALLLDVLTQVLENVSVAMDLAEVVSVCVCMCECVCVCLHACVCACVVFNSCLIGPLFHPLHAFVSNV